MHWVCLSLTGLVLGNPWKILFLKILIFCLKNNNYMLVLFLVWKDICMYINLSVLQQPGKEARQTVLPMKSLRPRKLKHLLEASQPRAESGSPSGWAESRPGALHHTPLSAQIMALKTVLVPSHKGLAGWILTGLLDKILLIDHHVLFSLFDYSSLGIGNLFFSHWHIFMSLSQFHLLLECRF